MTACSDAMKSKTLLDSFVHFCEVNPHLRFWQALACWAGANIDSAGRDTFYWSGQFGHKESVPPVAHEVQA